MEAVHDILESEDMDKVLDNAAQNPSDLYVMSVNNEPAPSVKTVAEEIVSTDMQYLN